MNIQQLERKLAKAKVSTKTWGIGIAKTSLTLLGEVSDKVSKVKILPDGRFERTSLKVHVDVFWFREDGVLMHLKEHRQVLGNGYVRKRPQGRTLSEKRPSTENKLTAGVRALIEELSIKVNRRDLVKTGEYITRIKRSDTYPGIWKKSKVTHYVYFVRKKHWKPFYLEHKNGRLTLFIWEPFF